MNNNSISKDPAALAVGSFLGLTLHNARLLTGYRFSTYTHKSPGYDRVGTITNKKYLIGTSDIGTSNSNHEDLRDKMKGFIDDNIIEPVLVPGTKIFFGPNLLYDKNQVSLFLKASKCIETKDPDDADFIMINSSKEVVLGSYYDISDTYSDIARISRAKNILENHIDSGSKEVTIGFSDLIAPYVKDSVIFGSVMGTAIKPYVNYIGSNILITEKYCKIFSSIITKGKRLIYDKVVDDYLLKSTIIDENVYDTLSGLFKSSLEEDNVSAMTILNTVDLDKSFIYVYRLCLSNLHKIQYNFNKIKSLRQLVLDLRDKNHFNIDSYEFIRKNRELLTPDIYKEHRQWLIDVHFDHMNNYTDLYDIKLVLRPEYQFLEPEINEISINEKVL